MLVLEYEQTLETYLRDILQQIWLVMREEEQEKRREQQQTRQTMVSVLPGLAKRLRPGFVVFVKAGGKLRQQVQNSPNLAEAS